MPITIKCLICGSPKDYPKSAIAKGGGKYCSRICYNKSKIGKPTWNTGKKNWMTQEHHDNLVKGTIRRNKRHPISSEQAQINGMKATPISGDKHYAWKGGKKKSSRGYIYKLAHNHPRAHNGYVFEHILVMEKHLDRYLKSNEIVHHINDNRTDNRISNLALMTRAAHNTLHKKNIRLTLQKPLIV